MAREKFRKFVLASIAFTASVALIPWVVNAFSEFYLRVLSGLAVAVLVPLIVFRLGERAYETHEFVARFLTTAVLVSIPLVALSIVLGNILLPPFSRLQVLVVLAVLPASAVVAALAVAFDVDGKFGVA
ncbi:hypothetical protein ACFQDG_15915 [Natronoarchaeum mannanilyticum]